MKHSYRDLYIWQAAVDLAIRIVQVTEDPRLRHRRTFVEQMQRSALSVPSNIAEGKGRLTPKDLRHFLSMARGSLFELATQLEIAARLDLVTNDDFAELTNRISTIGAGINNLMRHINTPQQLNSSTAQ